MKASLLTIGDEILIGQILNTNTAWMSEQLTSIGIEVVSQLTVGDHEAEIVGALEFIGPRSDVVIIGGGLGPTHDDLTLEALSHYFDMPLVKDSEWLAQVEKFFAERKRTMSENNKKQALLLDQAVRIDNDCGTAAGQHFQVGDTEFFVVPGVPHEMKSMMSRYILPYLQEKYPSAKILKQSLLTTGIGESALATRLDSFVQKIKLHPQASLAFLPSPTQVKLRLQMRSETELQTQEFDHLVEELIELCGPDYFANEPQTLEELLVQILSKNRQSLSLAESCTGGLIAHRLTQIPGASNILKGSLVAYQNQIKTLELGVAAPELESKGVVSESTAIAMAESIRKKWNTDFALSTTGFLGPTGGDQHAELGTAWIALACPSQTLTQVLHLENNRDRSKQRVAQAALDLLRRAL